MRILVIGGTGQISTEIVSLLLSKSHEVTIFNRGHKQVSKEVNCIQGDRHDILEFKRTFSGKRYDAVIDMICFNPEDARITVEAFQGKTDQFVFCSSIAAYKRPYSSLPITSDNPLLGEDMKNLYPYGYNKAQMERYLQSKMADGVPITIIRPSQTYGIGTQNLGALRTNYGLLMRMRKGKPIVVNGDGKHAWVWTFTPDLAKAFVGVLGKPICINQSYHATSDEVHIIDDLYFMLGSFLGIIPKLYHISTDLLYLAAPDLMGHQLFEKVYASVFDNSKIKTHVPEFKCEYTLERGLRMIFDWFIRDKSAQIIDTDKEKLEDHLCYLYENWVEQMSSIREGDMK